MRAIHLWILPALLVGCVSPTEQSYSQRQPPYFPVYTPEGEASVRHSTSTEVYSSGSYPDQPEYVDLPTAPIGSEVPDVTIFYDRLEPYGRWYDDPEYGYVFSPDRADYVPYANGYWGNTDYGFTWISYDPFGWATDHYGRWLWRDRWVWRPDTRWGPAWVQWRTGDRYVGWAPMGYDYESYVPDYAWRFVPAPYLTSRDLSRHYARSNFRGYLGDTRPVYRYHRYRDRSWVAGPGDDYLRRQRVPIRRERVDLDAIGRLDPDRRREAEVRARQYRESPRWQDRLRREATVAPVLDRRVERAEVERQRRAAEPRRRMTDEQRVRTEQRRRLEEQRMRDELRQRPDQGRERVEQQRMQNEQRQRAEQEQRRMQDEQRQRAEQEQRRMQDEQRQRPDQDRERAEQQRMQNEQRRRADEEQRRMQDEQRQRAEQEQRRMQDEQRQRAEQEQQRRMQDEQRQRAEQERRRMQDEQRQRPDQERERAEQQRMQNEQRQRAEQEQQRRMQEEQRQRAGQERERAEQQRMQDEQRQRSEQQRQQDQQRQQEQRQRSEQQQRQQEQQQRSEQQQRQQEQRRSN